MSFLDSIQSIISVYLLIAVGYILTKKEILSTEFLYMFYPDIYMVIKAYLCLLECQVLM